MILRQNYQKITSRPEFPQQSLLMYSIPIDLALLLEKKKKVKDLFVLNVKRGPDCKYPSSKRNSTLCLSDSPSSQFIFWCWLLHWFTCLTDDMIFTHAQGWTARAWRHTTRKSQRWAWYQKFWGSARLRAMVTRLFQDKPWWLMVMPYWAEVARAASASPCARDALFVTSW